MQIGTPEWSIWKFFRMVDNNLDARKYASKWQKENRERYNKTKREYLKRHEHKWAKQWKTVNPEKNKLSRKKSWGNTKHRHLEKQRRVMSKWRKENPKRAMAQMVRHFTKYGKKVGKPMKDFQFELLTWSNVVKTGDARLCQICFKPAIEAHHIFYIQNYPKLAFNVDNGVSLCKLCHQQVHGINLLKNLSYEFILTRILPLNL